MIRTTLAALLLSTAAFAQTAPVAPPELNAPPATAEHLDNGLITMKLKDGTGTVSPTADSFVKLKYVIWRNDGKMLENMTGDKAGVMVVSRMIPGWRDAILKMVAGEARRTWISSDLGGGKIPDGTSLMIDSELVEIVEGPKTPEDLTMAPADAQVSKSGLITKVLREGTGTKSPTKRSTVKVNYSGWTTEGRLFDSSVLRGAPSEIPLNAVIAGWTEGLQLMKEGEIRRFWIPSRLAYADDPSKPQGTLVFDIELISIVK
jgi:peptidylprolyl isomerase